jgi:hypothetical protein
MGSARSDVVVTEFRGPEVGKVYVKVNALLGGDVIPGSDAAPAGLGSSLAVNQVMY